VIVASGGSLLLAGFGTDVIRLLLTPEFEPARLVVPFSAFAYVLYGGWTVVTTGLNLESQTRWVPVAIGIAGAVSVGANLLLIPIFGFMGAAYVTLGSYTLLILLGGRFSRRYYPVAWEYRKVASALVIAFGLSLAAIHGPDHVAWRAGCVAAYPPLLLAIGAVTPAEVRVVARAIGARLRLVGP
jgi:O-antigen/teichoic acid export membrane protein